MSSTRRSFVLGLGIAGLGGLLAACGGSRATPTAAPAKPADAGQASRGDQAGRPRPRPPRPRPPTTAAAAAAKPPAEAAKPTEAPKPAAAAPAKTGPAVELIHWSSLTASDGEVWEQMVQNANKANEGKFVDQEGHDPGRPDQRQDPVVGRGRPGARLRLGRRRPAQGLGQAGRDRAGRGPPQGRRAGQRRLHARARSTCASTTASST